MPESACPLDCPDSCSLEVTVAGGTVRHVTGSTRNPDTAGFICAKVGKYPQHVHGRERILHPAVRVGAKGEGKFDRVSWDRALELIASRLATARDEMGGESILPLSYGGSNGSLTSDTTDARLFRRLGASRLLRTVCAAPTGAAATSMYGKMAGVALSDYVHARLIVMWGANPSVSGVHLVPFIQRARRDGARLVVIDPRRTPLAERADLHLALRPGTDLPLALALIRRLFEEGGADTAFLDLHAHGAEELRQRARAWTLERSAEICGVSASDIAELADLYARSHPAVIRCGWGLERNRNGGSAVAAVLALPAVAGKFGVRGGGYTLSNSGVWNLDVESAIAAPLPATRAINMNQVGRILLEEDDPPVRVLFVYNCNPVATLPHQTAVRAGLAREDLFTVVHEQVHTDTTRYADVILPATTFLEHEELRGGYGSMVLQHSRAVIDPVGESRPNYEVFAELTRRLGLSGPADRVRPDELIETLLARHPESARLRSELADNGIAFPAGDAPGVQFVDVFPRTVDHKVHLVPESLDHAAPGGLYCYREDPASARHPLALISPASRRTISSTLGQLNAKQARVAIHPTDATCRGITNGAAVRIHNRLGEVHCQAHITERVRPGVLSLPKGLWSRHTENGLTANALVPDTLTDLAGGACFNDARVEIEVLER